MSLFTKKKVLVTHSVTFHTDDVFATAALSLLLNDNVKVIRSREEKVIATADFVYDVGGVYDPETNRFDHHQVGGAGARENGIPYAAFGLVWKTYGTQICGSEIVAQRIDEHLVQAIDANDNGVNLFTLETPVAPYTLADVIFAFRPSYKEKQDYDAGFAKAVVLAKTILSREIRKIKDSLEAETFVEAAYQQAEDKRVIVMDQHYPWGDTLGAHPEPLYVVFPKFDTWRIECVRKEKHSFENRKPLPESWAGKRDLELSQITEVPDAIFCHNGRFMAVTKSKQSALKLAEMAAAATTN